MVSKGSTGRGRQGFSATKQAMAQADHKLSYFRKLFLPTLGLVIVGFVVVFVFGLFMPGRMTVHGGIGGAKLAEQIVREGRVIKQENGIVEFKTTFGELFMINPVAEGFRAPEPGSMQRVSLVPFRRSAENVYMARIRAIRKINEYSAQGIGDS